ncbi:MAG TPA: response regulator [Pyrinomonadaceae bacterium]|jgi:CheY-like chemotaxis protein
MPASILIADDYDDNRELLRLILAVSGYRIREARDGRECLAMMVEELPDILLVDLSMPVLDGWDVLAALRADERTRPIPCIAVTAFADADRERALRRGFDAYISKPFQSKELLETVERLLAKKHDGSTTSVG